MHAHSQFCLSGDTTLQATQYAIDSLAQEEADERLLIILSDANFDRYGISPARFGQILQGGEKVNAYAIFIGSLGDQAQRLVGHVYWLVDRLNFKCVLIFYYETGRDKTFHVGRPSSLPSLRRWFYANIQNVRCSIENSL